MEQILLHGISPDEFFEKIKVIVREIVREEMKQDQLLTREGALKVAGISNAVFMRAINDGIVKPQIIKDRRRAMYFESEVLKIEKGKRKHS